MQREKVAIDYLREIESKYPVNDIRLNNISLWPTLRVLILKKILEKNNIPIGNKPIKIDKKTIKTLISSIFYGFHYYLRLKKYDYWAFSSSERRKKINTIYHDRVIDGVSANFPNTLVIENPIPKSHIKHSSLAYKHVASDSILNLLTFVISSVRGVIKPYKIEHEKILFDMLKQYEITFNYKKSVKRLYGQIKTCQLLLLLHKPKMVFMAYPTSYMGYIHIFKKNNIPVIELQHGVVNEKHPSYNYYIKTSTNLLPDYFFTYGSIYSRYFNKNNHFIKKENVIPVGYYFLDLMAKMQITDSNETIFTNYELSIAFSSASLEDFEIPFLIDLAKAKSNWLILFIPRKQPFSTNTKLPNNLKVWPSENIYQEIKRCDIHSTIVSTTAIEAAFLGKATVFYNYENKSVNYYHDMLNKDVAYYANTVSEFIECVIHLRKNKIEINGSSSANLFLNNYSQNLLNAVQNIL